MGAGTVRLGERVIGPERPVLMVAELSGNHNGSLDRALALIRAAAEAGADAVKLQTYTADTMTMDGDGPWFRIEGGPWHGRRLHELYQEAGTPWEWHAELFACAREHGLLCFSTPFDATSLAYLEGLDSPCHKVASFEVTDLPFLRRVGATRRPVILSTGMATLDEITTAVETLRAAGSGDLVLLHCVSAYPARAEDMHLRSIADLAARFACLAGLSDHSLAPVAATCATALGAVLIEKHLTLRRADGGPDAGFSLEPEEFAATVQAVRAARAAAIGAPHYGPCAADTPNLRFRRSLFYARDLPAGHVLGPDDLRIIRPSDGLPPAALDLLIGRRLARAVGRATPAGWGDLAQG